MEEKKLRLDEITECFLAIREGKATKGQEKKFYDACTAKASYYCAVKHIFDYEGFLSDLICILMEKMDSFDPTRGSFSTWASWKCEEVSSDIIRKSIRQQERCAFSLDQAVSDDGESDFYDLIPSSSETTPEQNVLNQELNRILNQYINQLAPNQKEAVEMVYINRMGSGEAAEYLGRDKSCFYRHLNRGLDRLKTLLNKDGYTMAALYEYLEK